MVNMLQRKLGLDVGIKRSLLMSRKGTKNSCKHKVSRKLHASRLELQASNRKLQAKSRKPRPKASSKPQAKGRKAKAQYSGHNAYGSGTGLKAERRVYIKKKVPELSAQELLSVKTINSKL
jgi:hypothetical protein